MGLLKGIVKFLGVVLLIIGIVALLLGIYGLMGGEAVTFTINDRVVSPQEGGQIFSVIGAVLVIVGLVLCYVGFKRMK